MFLQKCGNFITYTLIFSIGLTFGLLIIILFIKQSPILAALASIFYLAFQKKEFKELILEKSYFAIFARAVLSIIASCFVGGWIWGILFFRSLDDSELILFIILPIISIICSAFFCFIKEFMPNSEIAIKAKQMYKGLYKMKILHDNTDPFLPKDH